MRIFRHKHMTRASRRRTKQGNLEKAALALAISYASEAGASPYPVKIWQPKVKKEVEAIREYQPSRHHFVMGEGFASSPIVALN